MNTVRHRHAHFGVRVGCKASCRSAVCWSAATRSARCPWGARAPDLGNPGKPEYHRCPGAGTNLSDSNLALHLVHSDMLRESPESSNVALIVHESASAGSAYTIHEAHELERELCLSPGRAGRNSGNQQTLAHSPLLPSDLQGSSNINVNAWDQVAILDFRVSRVPCTRPQDTAFHKAKMNATV